MEGLDRFRVAELTDDVVVLDRVTQVVYRIPGHLLDEVLSGRSMTGVEYLPAEAIPAIRAALSPGLLSRRRLIVAGSGIAVGGIVTAGLPFAAAASSPGFDTEVYSMSVDPRTGGSTVAGSGTTSSYWRVPTSSLSSTVQVGLGATNGTKYQDANSGNSAGSGAYIIATISGLPRTADDVLIFTARGGRSGGGAGNPDRRGGYGGNGVGLAYLNTSSGVGGWLAVAGGGGADGGAGTSGSPQPGGSHGRAGGGPTGRPGLPGTVSAGGAAGVNGYVGGTQPTAGTLASSVTDTSPTIGLGGQGADWETGRSGGGGGGSGYSGGGGGGCANLLDASDAGGGAGGLSWVTSGVAGIQVTFHVTYTVPRAFTFNHSTVLVELYSQPPPPQ